MSAEPIRIDRTRIRPKAPPGSLTDAKVAKASQRLTGNVELLRRREAELASRRAKLEEAERARREGRAMGVSAADLELHVAEAATSVRDARIMVEEAERAHVAALAAAPTPDEVLAIDAETAADVEGINQCIDELDRLIANAEAHRVQNSARLHHPSGLTLDLKGYLRTISEGLIKQRLARSSAASEQASWRTHAG